MIKLLIYDLIWVDDLNNGISKFKSFEFNTPEGVVYLQLKLFILL